MSGNAKSGSEEWFSSLAVLSKVKRAFLLAHVSQPAQLITVPHYWADHMSKAQPEMPGPGLLSFCKAAIASAIRTQMSAGLLGVVWHGAKASVWIRCHFKGRDAVDHYLDCHERVQCIWLVSTIFSCYYILVTVLLLPIAGTTWSPSCRYVLSFLPGLSANVSAKLFDVYLTLSRWVDFFGLWNWSTEVSQC